VLSLSPGPAPLEKISEMRRYAQMWRISNDIWDLWHSSVEYPQGLGDQFASVAKWANTAEPGHWPDADMLPLGYLGPAPGWGKPRVTKLTHAEQRTLVSLWCIFRSPLMIGGELPRADEWTLSLLSNPEVLAVDQQSTGNRVALFKDQKMIWVAQAHDAGSFYIAAFNLAPSEQEAHFTWKDLGLPDVDYAVRDVWERNGLPHARSFDAALPMHGSLLYQLHHVPEP
jgi:alpha-galactosidase